MGKEIYIILGTESEVSERREKSAQIAKTNELRDKAHGYYPLFTVQHVIRNSMVLMNLSAFCRATGTPIEMWVSDHMLDIYSSMEKKMGVFPIVKLSKTDLKKCKVEQIQLIEYK